jgi:hypothetical protein
LYEPRSETSSTEFQVSSLIRCSGASRMMPAWLTKAVDVAESLDSGYHV